jgi:AcrR family transcriptional regulator
MSTTDRTRETLTSTAKGDERRDTILATLRRLLTERRFAEIAVADITDRAGITRSAFYFYFPSKAAAVGALLEELRDNTVGLALSWYDGSPGAPEQRLRDGMRATIAQWRHNATLFAAVLDAAAVDPTANQLWSSFIHGFVVRVADRITHDTTRSPARNAPSATALAAGLVVMIFALMEQDVRDLLAGGEGIAELEDVLVHVWHAAIYTAIYGESP